jgi:hypothetical protein
MSRSMWISFLYLKYYSFHTSDVKVKLTYISVSFVLFRANIDPLKIVKIVSRNTDAVEVIFMLKKHTAHSCTLCGRSLLRETTRRGHRSRQSRHQRRR